MTALLARVRQSASLLGASLLILALLVIYGLRALRSRDRAKGLELNADLTRKLEEASNRVTEANARAAVEIAAARTKDADARAELREVMQEPDGAARRRRLLELRKRVAP